MTKSFFRNLFRTGLCLALTSLPANADVCRSILPSLQMIESGSGTFPTSGMTLGLGENECQFSGGDQFARKITCQWNNSPERIWTADDARDIGAKLHSNCQFLTLHFSGGRHENADYFLWFGDFTGVSLKRTHKGITLVIQVDEEAFYFS